MTSTRNVWRLKSRPVGTIKDTDLAYGSEPAAGASGRKVPA